MAWAKTGNIKGPVGATGSTGAQGPQGSPGVGFTWRGTWSGSTAYAINDCVQRTNQSYICTVANTGNDPASDVTHWNLMAAQGGTGPTGPSGTAGLNSFTITSASFTVPAVGATVTVTVNDATWAQLGEMVSIANAAGASLAGALQITNIAGNTLTLLNPQPPPAIPPADSTQAGLLKQLSGNTTDYVDGTNTCRDLTSAPAITLMRLRSFNAVGNPTFEVDQRNAGGIVTTAGATMSVDRWNGSKNGMATGVIKTQQTTGAIKIPGTNFTITGSYLASVVTTAQASLAAADFYSVGQTIEGSILRELINDVHSIQILCRSTIANQTFAVSLRDSTAAHSITFLCTLGAANVWTLITLPNIPIWTAGGTFPIAPGNAGYNLGITLACGTTYASPSNGSWLTGNYLGVAGQTNFAATAGAEFDLAFVQHEPGAVCTTLIDCPFSGPNGNLEACQRYFQKSYDYPTKLGTVTNNGMVTFYAPASGHCFTWSPFKRILAKVPGLYGYSPVTGAGAAVRDFSASIDRGTVAVQTPGDAGFGGFQVNVVNTGVATYGFHYSADTGW